MQEVSRPAVDAGTIRTMAAEVVRISLSPADINAVQSTVSALLDEIRAISPNDRAGVEPEPAVLVEEWPR